jgi:hypothetical protein
MFLGAQSPETLKEDRLGAWSFRASKKMVEDKRGPCGYNKVSREVSIV